MEVILVSKIKITRPGRVTRPFWRRHVPWTLQHRQDSEAQTLHGSRVVGRVRQWSQRRWRLQGRGRLARLRPRWAAGGGGGQRPLLTPALRVSASTLETCYSSQSFL